MAPTIATVIISLTLSEIAAVSVLPDSTTLPERRGPRPIHAPSGTIVGRVLSEGWPVSLAHVWTREQGIAVQTDSCGWFALGGVPLGRRMLIIMALGYRRTTIDHDVAEGASDTVLVEIEPTTFTRRPACDPYFAISYFQGDQPPLQVPRGALLCGNVFTDVENEPATSTAGWGSLQVSRHRGQCRVPVSWTHEHRGDVRLVVRDDRGAIVRTLARSSESQGSATWDGTLDGGDLAPPGEYVIRLESHRRSLELRVHRVVQKHRACP